MQLPKLSIHAPLIAFLLSTSIYLVSATPFWAHGDKVIVRMTKDDFIPLEVTVDTNQTVVFINEDTDDHWPASDIHPTHELYPEFDPKAPVKPGDKWEFQPKKGGRWKFHDHLFPHRRGLLMVNNEVSGFITPSPTSAPVSPSSTSTLAKIWQFIKKTWGIFWERTREIWSLPKPSPSPLPQGAQFKQLSVTQTQQVLITLVKDKGGAVSWQYLVQAFANEGGTSGHIHDLAHFLGAEIYKRDGMPGLSACGTTFAFGCFHGFLDTAFSQNLDKLSEAETACHKLGPGVSGPVASCIHGIGHGVASFFQTQKLSDALTTCERLTKEAQQYCYDGVFMEFERNAPLSFYDKGKPLSPCDTIDDKYRFACGRNIPPVMLNRFKFTLPQVIETCVKSTDTDIKNACVDVIGYITVSTTSGNVTEITKLCSSLTDTALKIRCIKAAAGELVFQEVPGWQTSSFALCQNLAVSGRAECNTHVARLIQEYGRKSGFQFNPYTPGEDKGEYVRSQMQICYQNGGKDSCYKEVASLFSSQFELRETLSLFAQNENHPEIYARCHEATHYLSRNEYQKTQSVPDVYSQCNSTCHGGCYHGVLEEYLKETGQSPTSEALKSSLTTICNSVKNQVTPLIYNECMHGLGHAAMFVTDMEIPASLTLCDAITDRDGRERCYSGVFMENSSSSTNTDHPGKYVKKDDPLYPCDTLEEKYLEQCYRYQSSYFAIITNHDWLQVANLCLSVPPPYQESCFRTVGTNQVGFTQDLLLMRQDCYLMPPQFQETCVAGVIGSFAYRFVGDITKMAGFCSSVKSEHQPDCFRQIGTSVIDWTTNVTERQNYCQKLNSQEKISWCKEGAV